MKETALYRAQERYKDRKIAQGDKRITLWIPNKHTDNIKEIAQLMREGKWVKEEST